MTDDYKEMTRRIKENIQREYAARKKKIALQDYRSEAQQRAIDKKRQELRDVKAMGGGHAIAKRMLMAPDTDFDYGFNDSPETGTDIDKRIAEQAAGRCMGKVYCLDCNKYHGYCVEIEEKIKMLPTGDETPTGTKRKVGGMEFLKNEDLSRNPKEAKILAVRLDSENKYGPRINIKLAIDGKTKFWGVPTAKSKSPNYRLLLDKFGAEENDWIDRRILLFLEQDDFSGNFFMRVDFPSEPKSESPKRGR